MMKWINDWNKWIIALLLLVAGMKVEGQSAKGDSVAVWEKDDDTFAGERVRLGNYLEALLA